MRRVLVILHRCFGLSAALFLFLAGLTGALISWDHEIDEWLNPELYRAPAQGRPLSAVALAARLERAEPQLQVRYLPLASEAGRALTVYVEARPDPVSGETRELGYNRVALDPVSGKVLGRREWGKVSLARENLMPFLYKLHYTMHLPNAFGVETGVLFMGLLAIAWLIDCFVALWLCFPSLRSWRQSFAFRWKAGGYRLNFDLHRSGGVWLFPLLLMLALTSVGMNLRAQVVEPIVSLFSPLTPPPFAAVRAHSGSSPKPALLGAEQILARAEAEARRRAWRDPPGGLFIASRSGLYGVGFFAPGKEHGDGGLGNPWLYFDAHDGRLIGSLEPGRGSAGDVFLQALFPLHSGRILGTPGRVLISLCGLAVAMLSVTGIVIWAKKRRARVLKSRSRIPRPA